MKSFTRPPKFQSKIAFSRAIYYRNCRSLKETCSPTISFDQTFFGLGTSPTYVFGFLFSKNTKNKKYHSIKSIFEERNGEEK